MTNTFYFVNSEAMDIRDENGEWLDYPTKEQYEDALTKDDELILFTDYDTAVEVAQQGLAEDETYAFPIYTFTSELKGKPVKYEGIPARRLNRDDLELVSVSLEHVDESFEEVLLNDSPESSEDESNRSESSSSSNSSSESSDEEVVVDKKAKKQANATAAPTEAAAAPVAPKPATSLGRRAWNGTLYGLTAAYTGTLAALAWTGTTGLNLLSGARNVARPLVRPSIIAGATTVGGKVVADALGQTPELIGKLGDALTNSTPAMLQTAAQTVDSAVDSIPYVKDVKSAVYLGVGAIALGEAAHQGYNLYQRRAAAKAAAPANVTKTEEKAKKRAAAH